MATTTRYPTHALGPTQGAQVDRGRHQQRGAPSGPPCFTCGAAPSRSFPDGSAQYDCSHPPVGEDHEPVRP